MINHQDSIIKRKISQTILKTYCTPDTKKFNNRKDIHEINYNIRLSVS